LARKLVIGNWKLNGSLAMNEALLEGLLKGWIPGPTGNTSTEMVVCPPAIYVPQTENLLSGSAIQWGAQDLSNESQGAYTGELSGSMLLEFGCRYVLVGHSERRSRWAETSSMVAAKAASALNQGLIPVICIGETLAERESGATLSVLADQLAPVLSMLTPQALAGIVIAYEPLWAIGTGRNADGKTAQEVHAFIRNQLAQADLACAAEVPLLYGGSVKAANAAEYAAQSDIDGVLVGGASLVISEFLNIGRAFESAAVS